MILQRPLRVLLAVLAVSPIALEPAHGEELGLRLVRETIHPSSRAVWDCLTTCPNLTGRDPAEAGIGKSEVTNLSGNQYYMSYTASSYAGLSSSPTSPWSWSAWARGTDTWAPLVYLEVTGDPGAQAIVSFEWEFDIDYTMLLFAVPPGFVETEAWSFVSVGIGDYPRCTQGCEREGYREEFFEKAIGVDFDVSKDYFASGSKTHSKLATVGDQIELFGNLFAIAEAEINPFGISVGTTVATARFTVTVTPVNRPPVADAGPDQVEECTSPDGAYVTLDGTASYDPDGDPITYLWADSFGEVEGPTPTVPFPFGTETVTLVVTDDKGDESAPDTAQVTVVDTTPPSIDVSASPSVLWPPSNKMVRVTLETGASDDCDAEPTCQITSVTSNEPAGRHADWLVHGDLSLDLRSKRRGKGSGRVYTIGVTCTDAFDNQSTATTEVVAPHDRRR